MGIALTILIPTLSFGIVFLLIGIFVHIDDIPHYKPTYKHLVSGTYKYVEKHCDSLYQQSYFYRVGGNDYIIIFGDGSVKLAETIDGHLFMNFPNPFAWYWGYKINKWFKNFLRNKHIDRTLDQSKDEKLQNISDVMVDIFAYYKNIHRNSLSEDDFYLVIQT